MKKKIILLLSLTLIGFMFFAAGVPTAGAEPVKLTYSCLFPPTHIQAVLAQEWCKEVEKRTNGQVVIEFYPAGTLTKGPKIYDGVVTGLSDIGFSVLAYTRGRFPVMFAVDLYIGWPSGKVATAVANDVYTHFNPKELQDTQVMYLNAHGPGLVHTKGVAVKKLEDLKGLKLRAHGTSAIVVKALGAIPIAKGMNETQQLLQKGIVEGSCHPMEADDGWKLAAVVDNVVAAYSAGYTTDFFVVMNKDKWNALSADVQKTITEINQEWVGKHGEAWDTSDMLGIQAFLNAGGTIHGLDKKEAARWAEATKSIADDYAKKLTEQGLNGEEIKKYIAESVKKHSK